MSYITIRILADELGVSKTSVTKKLDELHLRDELQKVGNKVVLTPEQAQEVRKAFAKRNRATEQSNETSRLIDMLQEELSVKNQQIAQLQDTVQQLTKVQAIQTREILRLTSGAEVQTEPTEPTEPQEVKNDPESKEPKNGLFSRFFKR